MYPPTPTSRGKHLAVLDLNDDVLLTLVKWFEALELLSWGMTCKRLYQTISAKALWLEVAHRLQDSSTGIRLPLEFGDTIETCSLIALQKATSRACRLDRNLQREEPHLYHFAQFNVSRNPFKTNRVPGEATDCVHIINGKWILYRRQNNLCIRHVQATKQKEVIDVPIVAYAGWSFQVSQVEKNTVLVTTRHDVNEVWGLLEITLGENRDTKPKIRTVDIGSPFKIRLAGSSIAVMTKSGVNRVANVYDGKNSTLDHVYSVQMDYLHSGGFLFVLNFRPGGRIRLTAQQMDTSGETMLKGPKSELKINLKKTSKAYPPDQFFAEASLRDTSDGLLTVWHRVHMKVKDQVYYAHYIIDIPYARLEDEDNDEGEGEVLPLKWGHWQFRTTYVANGQQYIGQNGTSLLLARHVEGMPRLTVYRRLQLGICHWDSRIANRGTSLPTPKEMVPGSDIHSVRVAWDDTFGIAVLLLENGVVWVLHYA